MVHTNEEHVSYLSHSAQPQIPVVFVMFVWPYLQPDWFSPPTVTLLLDLLHAMTHWWPHCCCYTSGFCLLKTEECWLRMFFFFFLVSHTVDVNGLEMNCFRAGYLIMFFFWLQLKSDVFLVWCHGIHDRFESTPHCVIPGPITNVYTHLYHEPVRVCDVFFLWLIWPALCPPAFTWPHSVFSALVFLLQHLK